MHVRSIDTFLFLNIKPIRLNKLNDLIIYIYIYAYNFLNIKDNKPTVLVV